MSTQVEWITELKCVIVNVFEYTGGEFLKLTPSNFEPYLLFTRVNFVDGLLILHNHSLLVNYQPSICSNGTALSYLKS